MKQFEQLAVQVFSRRVRIAYHFLDQVSKGTRCVRDCESIIQISRQVLFTTEDTKNTEKIMLLIQPIKNSVLSVSSVVNLLNRILSQSRTLRRLLWQAEPALQLLATCSSILCAFLN
jgi:hypothetical protein